MIIYQWRCVLMLGSDTYANMLLLVQITSFD